MELTDLGKSTFKLAADDGAVRMTANGKTATAHLKGFTPPLRRTALVFFFGSYVLLKMPK
jgi:hypothetical protein